MEMPGIDGLIAATEFENRFELCGLPNPKKGNERAESRHRKINLDHLPRIVLGILLISSPDVSMQSSAELKSPRELDFRWNCRLRDLQVQLESRASRCESRMKEDSQ